MAKYARANPARWWKTRWVGSAHRSPAAMFISPLRRYTTLSVLLILLSLIGGLYYLANPQRISRMAQILLSEVLGGKVVVGSGQLSFAGTLQLSGVELRAGEGKDPSAVIFSADQVEMRFDWLSLLGGQLRATQITAIQPTFNLIEDRSTQRWNYELLRPVRGSDTQPLLTQGNGLIAQLPVIVLRQARIQWGERDRGLCTITANSVIDGQFVPDSNLPTLYRFELQPRHEAIPGETLASENPNANTLGRVTGTWDVQTNHFSSVVENVTLGSALQQSVPRQVREWWIAHQLAGKVNSLRTTFDPKDGLQVAADFDNIAMTLELDPKITSAPHTVTIPIRQVRGNIEWGINKGNVLIRQLRGQVLGYHVNIDGELHGTSKDAPFDINIRLPNMNIREYPPVLLMFADAEELLQRLRPRGLMDVAMTLKRSANGPIEVEGYVDCKDVSARFYHFPYPMEHVQGRLTFDNHYLQFHQVHALAGETRVVLNGIAGMNDRDNRVDFTVATQNMTFDDRLGDCLSPRYQKVWRRFNPTGLGSFVCRVTREEKFKAPLNVEVDIQLQDVNFCYDAFPYPVHKVRGRLVIRDEETLIENLTGRVGPDNSGEMTFNGQVKYPRGNLDAVEPTIKLVAKNIPVDQSLLYALPESHQSWARAINLGGRLAIDGTLTRVHGDADHPEDDSGQLTGKLQLRDGSLRLADNVLKVKTDGLALNQLAIDAELVPGKVTISRFTAAAGDKDECHLSLNAVIDQTHRNTTQLTIAGDWQSLRLQPEPFALLPTDLATPWSTYRPNGLVDGDVKIRMEAGPEGLGALLSAHTNASSMLKEYSLNLRPRNLTLTPKDWPDSLTNINGEVSIVPKQVEIKNLTAQSGPINFTTSGIYTSASDTQPESRLKVALKAQSDSFPVKWINVFPKDLGDFISSIKPESALTLDLPEISRTSLKDQVTWNFNGDITLNQLKTQGEFECAAKVMKLSGKGQWDPVASGLDFDGQLSAKHIAVGSKIIDTFDSHVVGSAAHKTLAMSAINGEVAGGTLQGNIVVWMTPAHATETATATRTANANGPRYEGTLVLNDANLASLILPPTATAEERKKIGTGRVTANLAVQEQFGTHGAGRTGRGELVIRDGTIYDVPLSMGLMQLATLRLPVSRAFNNAQLSYYLRDNKVTFEKIILESPGINLVGLGTMTLRDRQLDLRLLTETPHEFHIPVITEIVQGARNQLLQIKVTGPADNPKVEAVPLDAVSSALEKLLHQRLTGKVLGEQ